MQKIYHHFWQKHLAPHWQHYGFRKYASNISWMLICKIVSTLVSIVASVLIARYLAPDGYGVFSAILSFVAIFNVSLFVIDSVLVKKLNQEPENRNEILGSALLVKIINNTIGFLIVLVAALFSVNSNWTLFLIILYSSSNFGHIFGLIEQQFQADAKNKPTAIATAAFDIIFALARIVIVLLHLNVAYIITTFVLYAFSVSIRYIILYQKHYHNITAWRINWSIVKYFCLASIPFSIAALTGTVGGEIDKLILKTFADSEAVGFYTVASTLTNGWGLLLGVISVALLPAVLNAAKTNHQLFLARLKKYYSLFFYATTSLAIFTFLIAPWAIKILYGEAYSPSIALLRVTAWSIIFSYLGIVLQQVLLAENKFKLILLFSGLGAIANILFNWILIPQIGVMGAAVSRLFCSFVPLILVLALPILKDQRQVIWRAIFKPLS